RQLSKTGQRGRTCTCAPSVPSRGCCCYTTRCCPGEWLVPGACFCGDGISAPWNAHPSEIWRFGGLEGTCTLSLPADNGLLRSLSYESKRGLVGSAGNAPVRRFRHIFYDARFTVEQPDHLPGIGSGGRNCTGLKRFMRPSSVLSRVPRN